MEFINRTSRATEIDQIVQDLTQGIDSAYDLGILFFTQAKFPFIKNVIEGLNKKSVVQNLLGCTCAGIIGSNEEIEYQSAVSVIYAKLPGVKIVPFSVDQEDLDRLKNKKDCYQFFEVFPNENPVFIAFPDPFRFDMNVFLEKIDEAYPRQPIIGGIASAASEPNQNILSLNGDFYNEGVVGVILTGDIRVDTVVSQGCRPIGETYIVTKGEQNIIFEVAGKPFIEILEGVLEKSSARDKLLAQEAIFVGIAMDEYKHGYKRGDFLIRGLMGIDQNLGAGAIGDYIKTGQTIQFHVRDAHTATEDLSELLSTHQKNNLLNKPKGALVFSCNGRGEGLFHQKNHDISIIQNYLGPMPAAGFFCAGEIGPIGGKNFLHGFTDSIALFYPKN